MPKLGHSILKIALLTGVLFTGAGQASESRADPVTPVDPAWLPSSSSPYISYAYDPTRGFWTGADADVSSVRLVLSTDAGFLAFDDDMLDGFDPVFIQTGLGAIAGVAIMPYGYVVCKGNELYLGHVDGESWITDKLIQVYGLTSNFTDVDVAVGFGTTPTELGYDVFVATDSQGVRRVDSINGYEGTAADLIAGGLTHSFDVSRWVEANPFSSGYDQGMYYHGSGGGLHAFVLLDGTAHFFCDDAHMNLNQSFIPTRGVAYFNGGIAVVSDYLVEIHAPLPSQDYMASITVPGDLDGDGDADLADFELFLSCMTGPDVPCSAGCQLADLDHEGDVDLEDFADFQAAYGQ